MAAAWRAHEDMEAPSPRSAAALEGDGEEQDVAELISGAEAMSEPASPGASTSRAGGAASSAHPTTSGVGFPASLEDYVLFNERPSRRRAPRERSLAE